MSKVNKFRMWDKRLKEMAFTGFHLVGEVTAFGGMEYWIQENWEKTKDECPTSMERWNDFIEMQYIGKQDMLGVDVYDGDLIEIFWAFGEPTCEAISYDEEYSYWKYGNNPLCELNENKRCTQFKVIGHIYEEKK